MVVNDFTDSLLHLPLGGSRWNVFQLNVHMGGVVDDGQWQTLKEVPPSTGQSVVLNADATAGCCVDGQKQQSGVYSLRDR